MGKKRFFNFKNLFFVSFLAVAGIFSATAIIKDKQVEEAPVVEKVEAVSSDRYLTGDSDPLGHWNSKAVAMSKDSGGNWYKTFTFGTNDEFKVTDGTWNDGCNWGSGNIDGDSEASSNFGGSGNIKCTTGGTYTVVITSSNQIRFYSGTVSYQSGKVGWVVALNNSGGTSFSVSSSVKMGAGTGSNYAEITGISMNGGAHFQIAYSDGYGFTKSGWKTGVPAADSGFTKPDGKDYFRVTAAGTVDVYGYDDGGYKMSAVYHAPTTTVTLDRQSGTGGTGSVTATYGDEMPTITAPTRTGYTFGGYYTGTSGGGTKYYNANGSSAKNWDFTDSTKTLYAKWTINSYTITYHRNDEHTTDNTYYAGTFNYGSTSHTVLSIDESPISWGSSYLRKFEKWNTASNGTGTSYYPGDTFTVPAENTTLYSIQRWHTFQCSSDQGTHWTTLTTSSLTGYLVQFEPSSDMTLTAGVPLRFRYQPYGSAVWTEIDNSKIAYSGNYGESGVSINAAAKVYLKVPNEYTVGEYECYVAGLSDLTAVVTHNGISTYFGGYEDGKDPGGNKQFRISGYLYCHAGDTLKADYQGNNLHDVYLDNEGAGFDRGTPTTCAVSGAYIVYLKSHDDGYSWNNVYVTRNEEASAKYFAQIFNNTLSSVCAAVSAGTKGLSDIQAVWGTTASTGLRGEYADFSSATKAYFTGATSTSDADILACIEKYNYIENKYGTTALPNFMGRTGYKPAVNNFSPFDLFQDGGETLPTVIIIVASSISLLSITALSVLVVKKRKTKER